MHPRDSALLGEIRSGLSCSRLPERTPEQLGKLLLYVSEQAINKRNEQLVSVRGGDPESSSNRI